jgi:integrase
MRLKDYDSQDGKRVWLSEDELQLLLDHVDENHLEADFALRLMARSGLRRREVTGDGDRHGIRFADVRGTDVGDVVRVWAGKGDKYRETPAPRNFASEVSVYRQSTGRDADAGIVKAHDSTLYDWVERARQRCRAKTGDEGWQFVGPHDLRRSFGVRMLEEGVLPSVVMEWGGWEDWQTFRDHYLAEFSPEALRRERSKVSWLPGRAESESGDHYSVVEPRGSGAANQRAEQGRW